MTFDPDAAATSNENIFGIPCSLEEARIVVVPVPFDATTSYKPGTAEGPEAVRRASVQVDLLDHQFGPIWKRGIWMDEASEEIAELNAACVQRLGRGQEGRDGDEPDDETVAFVNKASERVNRIVRERVEELLKMGKVPVVLGGDHSTPFGAIEACATWAKRETGREGNSVAQMGLLQVDAHMDLREAFEGFTHSHASIMYNVLTRIDADIRLVQVGIRDYGQGERAFAEANEDRVLVHYDLDMAKRMDDGVSWAAMCREIVDPLPKFVYVSFDIDGLEPSLCPNTGTPVPGGLSFNQAAVLLETVAHSGRVIVGMDLCEVGVSGDGEWGANVGARVLYKMCGMASHKR